MSPKTDSGKNGATRGARTRPAGRAQAAPSPRKKTRKAPAKGASSPAKKRTSLFLPLLSAWLLVAVTLAGLIYWGNEDRKPDLVPTTRRDDRQTQNQARTLRPPTNGQTPVHREPPQQPRRPTGEGIEEKQVSRVPDSSPTQQHPAATEAVEAQKQKIPEPELISRPELKPKEAVERNPGTAVAAHTAASRSADPQPAPPPSPPGPVLKPPLAKVAIVIDDFGPDVDTARKFLALPIPITFSILPFQRHSKDIAELAHSHNREVILHAPMEPQGYPMVKPGTGGLLISMSSAEVQKRLRNAADSCPYAAGINNHMGSRFTENIGAMGIVLAEIRNRGLYFLDSYTSSRSMAYSVAEKMQVPHLRRDIFLDHVVAEDQIRAQLNQLVRKAKVQGRAIAIGHPHEATLHVLAQEAAMFQKEGIMVVPAGELVSAAPSIPSPH